MITTSKKINLEQLDNELGAQGLEMTFGDSDKKIIKPADNSTLTKDQLEAGIDAHIAQPTAQEMIELNRKQGLAKLKELGFTDDQITALLNG